jgi:beta,beta-carotene 9',10'-dioxygenase
MVSLATDATLGLTNLDDEIVVDELELEGELPAWLAGSLLRTGPARWDLGEQTVNHWFDGLAMLHRFTIAGGSVSYANRFLRSKAFEAAQDGTIGFSEFATDPCRSAFKRVASLFDPAFTDNGNVNVPRRWRRSASPTARRSPSAASPIRTPMARRPCPWASI